MSSNSIGSRRKKTKEYVEKEIESFSTQDSIFIDIPTRSLLTRNLSTFDTFHSKSSYFQVFRHYLSKFIQMNAAGSDDHRHYVDLASLFFHLNESSRHKAAAKSPDPFYMGWEGNLDKSDQALLRKPQPVRDTPVDWMFHSIQWKRYDNFLQWTLNLRSHPYVSPQKIDESSHVDDVTFQFEFSYQNQDIKITSFEIIWNMEGCDPVILRGNPNVYHEYHYSWILDMMHSLFCEIYTVRPTEAQEAIKALWYQPVGIWLSTMGVTDSPFQMALNSMKSSFAFKMLFAQAYDENPAIFHDFFIQAFLDPKAKLGASKMALDAGTVYNRHGEKVRVLLKRPSQAYVDLALSPSLFSSDKFFMDHFAHELAYNLDEDLQKVYIPQVKSPLFVKVFSALWTNLLHTSDHMIYFANPRIAHEINSMDPSWPAFEHLQEEVFRGDKPSVIHWNSQSPPPLYAINTANNWQNVVQFVMFNSCIITTLFGHSKEDTSRIIEVIAESYTPHGPSFAWMSNLLRFLTSQEELSTRFSNDKKRRFYLQIMNFVTMAADPFEYQQSCEIVNDIMVMWSQLPQNLRDQITLRKIRTVMELHNICSVTLSKVKNPEFPIDNPVTKLLSQNLDVPDMPYLIVMPKTNQDIITWGTVQGHCLGTYAHYAAKNERIILGIKNQEDNSWFAHMMLVPGDKSGTWKVSQMYQARNTAVPEPQRSNLIEYVLTYVNQKNGEKV